MNAPVADLDSLHTHHPKRNFSAGLVYGLPVNAENTTTRSYAVVGGEFQEVLDGRVDKYRSLQPDQVLLIKDFILDDMTAANTRRVDVPSPVAGVIGRVDLPNGVVDVHETADGPLVARIRHLGPIAVEVGDSVAYGQSLGTQNNIGLGPKAGKHVHIEMDTRHYQQFGNYMLDLVEGRLPVQAVHRDSVEPRTFVDDGVQRVGEAGERVAAVQRALVAGGYRGTGDAPIAVDGVYRLSMQGAVLQFQQDQGLEPSADVDAPTWRKALDLTLGKPLLPPTVADESPEHPPAAQQGLLDRIRGRLGALDPPDGPALSGCERERVACSLLRLAVEHRLDTVDHVLPGGGAPPGSSDARVFVVQGRLDDPAQRRAWMPMAEALGTPVAESVAYLRMIEEASVAMSAHRAAVEQAQEMTMARVAV
ncbi:peptidoglycan-binding protein [Luteimonas terricola]|uniref:Peptidoglycan-binding protein n=2 Tax=Luteimonas terricola TaxID=645597 RepID=A0ABQ2E9H9_9GAMM|nr:peptidoglycan-binding protein [Luteimonas terricola]